MRSGHIISRSSLWGTVRPMVAMALVVLAFGTLSCQSRTTADSGTAAATAPDTAHRLPEGWPTVLALDADAEITFVADNSRHGSVHQVVIAEVDGIGQNVFQLYADALESVDYEVTIDHTSEGLSDLSWALHATKGPRSVTVKVQQPRDEPLTVRFTHFVPAVDE